MPNYPFTSSSFDQAFKQPLHFLHFIIDSSHLSPLHQSLIKPQSVYCQLKFRHKGWLVGFITRHVLRANQLSIGDRAARVEALATLCQPRDSICSWLVVYAKSPTTSQ